MNIKKYELLNMSSYKKALLLGMKTSKPLRWKYPFVKLFLRKDKSGGKAKSHELVIVILPAVVAFLLCADPGNGGATGAAPGLLLLLRRFPA